MIFIFEIYSPPILLKNRERRRERDGKLRVANQEKLLARRTLFEMETNFHSGSNK